MLRQHGAQVDAAESASEAFQKFQERKPDILVSDVGMPGEDGYSLLNKIRALPSEQIRRTPAIALTGFARDEDKAKAAAAGFDTHVSKPIDPIMLVQAIIQFTSLVKI
jgi:CheY-like chemotaxis protein